MLSSVNYVNIYLFSIFFFNRFCPMVKCRVTLHCLYCDSLTLRFHNHLSIYRDIAHLTCQISQQTFLVFQDVFKISWKRLQRNIFLSPKTCLQDVFKTSSWTRLSIISWRRLGRQKNVTLKTSSRRLQYAFTKMNVCWDSVYILYFMLYASLKFRSKRTSYDLR